MTGPTRRLVVGMDVGGTKSHVIAEDASSGDRVLDVVVPNPGWTALDDAQRAAALVKLAESQFPEPGEVAAIVAGVHGSDSPSQQDLLRSALAAGYEVADVVNDSELLLPAHGTHSGTGVIAGTGSSATSHTADGTTFTVGGWGWFLGDEGGAVGIVRDAAREVLAAHDRQEDDPLRAALLDALDAPHPNALGTVLTTVEPRTWASAAPVVFAAAETGSARARRVLERQASALAALVVTVRDRGGSVETVVAAGGVMTNQPAFFDLFARAVHRTIGATVEVALLTSPPATGGLTLARRLIERRPADLAGGIR